MSVSNAGVTKSLPKQLFIAPKAQGKVMYRAMWQLLIATFATTCVSFGLSLFSTLDPLPVAITAMVAVVTVGIPFVLYDAAKTSGQVVGAFVRVQGMLRQMAHGDPVELILIRDDELWQEWMQEFNVLVSRIQAQRDPNEEITGR